MDLKDFEIGFFPFPRKVLPLCINDLFLNLCDKVTAGMCVWADLMNLPHRSQHPVDCFKLSFCKITLHLWEKVIILHTDLPGFYLIYLLFNVLWIGCVTVQVLIVCRSHTSLIQLMSQLPRHFNPGLAILEQWESLKRKPIVSYMYCWISLQSSQPIWHSS